MEFDVREATHDDYDAVVAFTEDTWPDREGGDYIPRIYHDWIEGDERETFVAEPRAEPRSADSASGDEPRPGRKSGRNRTSSSRPT
ncbi:hypothetical protein [Halospeciosus flavus]|uniref:Uncharacterized protein n=1 Tax=Halospeciosus flavus TaxID=3032283 RepID=A0ABD5Z9I4_9EURY